MNYCSYRNNWGILFLPWKILRKINTMMNYDWMSYQSTSHYISSSFATWFCIETSKSYLKALILWKINLIHWFFEVGKWLLFRDSYPREILITLNLIIFIKKFLIKSQITVHNFFLFLISKIICLILLVNQYKKGLFRELKGGSSDE